jgi:hypothetical protein
MKRYMKVLRREVEWFELLRERIFTTASTTNPTLLTIYKNVYLLINEIAVRFSASYRLFTKT